MGWLAALRATMMITLFLMFGLLFAILAAIGFYFNVPIFAWVIFAIVLMLIQWAVGPAIIWATTNMRPIDIRDKEYGWVISAVQRICKETKTPVPKKIALARVGTPNAFVFGRTPRSANLAVTQGLINSLSREEVEAVIGHEVGHIRHKDMIVMTMVSVIPVIMYYIAISTLFARTGRDRGGAAILVGLGAYIVYILSNLVVFWLSRMREYYADAFSAENYKKPRLLASALAKITYGLGTKRTAENAHVRAFCIGDPVTSAGELAHFAAEYADFHLTEDELKKALEWERKNPIVRRSEVFRTHPLTFKRIARLRQLEKELAK